MDPNRTPTSLQEIVRKPGDKQGPSIEPREGYTSGSGGNEFFHHKGSQAKVSRTGWSDH